MLTNVSDNLGFLIHDVGRLYRARFDEMARPLGVTRPQWRALLHLSIEPGQSQSDLADRLEVERITLCRMVDRLAENGLVERRADPSDRRVWRLHLTTSALQIVEQLSQIGRDLEEQVIAQIGTDRTDVLRETLKLIGTSMKAPAAELVAAE
jgi:MarR family transcriptional regulator, transcriptional regulator for hemolysin